MRFARVSLVLLVLGLCSVHGQTMRIDPTSGERLPDAAPPPDAKARVVVVENPSLVNQFQVNDSLVQDSFNRALLTLTNTTSLKAAWLTLVTPDDVVGIKIASAGGQLMGQHRALVQAVIAGLKEAGIPASNIVVWDKFDYSLKSAGYIPESTTPGGWRVRSVIPGAGFDPKVFYFNEVVGQLIWGDSEFRGKKQFDINALYRAAEAKPDPGSGGAAPTPDAGGGGAGSSSGDGAKSPSQISNRSYITKLVTTDTTKIINIASMTDHAEVGIAGCLASLALNSVDNSRRFTSNGAFGDPSIAEILTNDTFTGKIVLNVMDGLILQYAGGPNFAPLYADSAGILMLSSDPVAIDTLTLERIEARRADRSVVAIGDAARHIATCARLGLGKNKPDQIDVISSR